MRDSVSCGLSYACSTRASSSRCDWLRRPLTLYASLSFSSARTRSFVSCLYDSGGKGMGANLRDSSQWTVAE